MRDAHPTTRHLEQVRLRVAAGADPGDLTALDARARATLRVAVATGAPLLATLDAAIAADRDASRAARAVTVASAQGRAVAGGLLVAPLLLVPVLGRLFAVDLVAYHATPQGLVTGGLGVGLLVTGAVLARGAVASVARPVRPRCGTWRLVRAVVTGVGLALIVHPLIGVLAGLVLSRRHGGQSPPVDAALPDAIELVATAIAGGGGMSAALRTAATEVPTLARPLRRLAFDLEHGHEGDDHPPGVDRFADVLATAAGVGAPVGATLRRLAADLRADELARVLAAAERLPVRMTFPTALCLLPGTLLLIGAPIVAAGLGAVGAN